MPIPKYPYDLEDLLEGDDKPNPFDYAAFWGAIVFVYLLGAGSGMAAVILYANFFGS